MSGTVYLPQRPEDDRSMHFPRILTDRYGDSGVGGCRSLSCFPNTVLAEHFRSRVLSTGPFPEHLAMNATLMSDPVGETRNYRSVLTLSPTGSASCSADPKTYSEKEYVSRQGSLEARRKMGVKDRRMMFFGKY